MSGCVPAGCQQNCHSPPSPRLRRACKRPSARHTPGKGGAKYCNQKSIYYLASIEVKVTTLHPLPIYVEPVGVPQRIIHQEQVAPDAETKEYSLFS